MVPVLEKSGESIEDLNDFISGLNDTTLSELTQGLQQLKANGLDIKRAIEFGVEYLVSQRGYRTFSDVSEELIKLKEARVTRGDLREVSLMDFSYRCRKMAKDFGDVTLELLSRGRVVDWTQSLNGSGRNNENYRRICVEVFNYAMNEGYVKFSPLSELRGQRKKALTGSLSESANIGALTINEAKRLPKFAMELNEFDLLGYVILTLFCGVRSEEAKRAGRADC